MSVDSSDAVQQMNSELQHAQLELLSAHCAVHQLRLHYSVNELARFGRRDVVRKSAEAASALHAFYSRIESNSSHCEPLASLPEPTTEQLAQAVEWLVSYLQQQRDLHLPVCSALTPQHISMLRPHFSYLLLAKTRVFELHGARLAPPEFFEQIRAAGFEPPAITHMDSVTFGDVIVFNQHLTLRALFHALVHSAQIQLLGLRRYAELWVQSFVKTRTHFTVPLEVHAFTLSSKFLSPLTEEFSVEEQILRWKDEGRY